METQEHSAAEKGSAKSRTGFETRSVEATGPFAGFARGFRHDSDARPTEGLPVTRHLDEDSDVVLLFAETDAELALRFPPRLRPVV